MNEEIKNILAEKQEVPPAPAKIPGVYAPPAPAKIPGVYVPPDPAKIPGVYVPPAPAAETPGVYVPPDPASQKSNVTYRTCQKKRPSKAL